jgi:DNA-binding beta-propeller fold protein YncE
LARDPASGDLFVADTGNGRISRYSSSGDLVSSFAVRTSDGEAAASPLGVAVDSAGQVYVAAENRLLAFDTSGAFVKDWRDAEGRPFSALADIATDRDGRVFALDSGNGRVIVIQPDGTVSSWGSVGGGDGELQRPTGLAVRSGTVVVADAGNARIMEFDRDGTFREAVPVPEWQGATDGAVDVAISDAGEIWASVPSANSIVKFRADGSAAGAMTPTGDDQLDQPSGLALQPGGALFVSNLGSNRITLLTQPNP